MAGNNTNVIDLYRNKIQNSLGGSSVNTSSSGSSSTPKPTSYTGTPYELFGAYTGSKYKTTSNTGTPAIVSPLATSSGGSGSTSSSSSSSTTNPYTSYADQLQALYKQQQDNLNAYQQAQKAAAQNAYNKNYAALQSAYNNKLANLDSSLNNAKDQLAGSYDASKQSIDSDAAKAMQEAYVNRMLSQKNLQQQLTAQGLSGGASESAIAGLINNYGNARNEIDTTRNTNLSNLEQTYNQNLADIMQNYYNAKSAADESKLAYQMQLENALADNSTASYGNLYNAMTNLDNSYLNAMQNALSNQAAYQAKVNTANNNAKSVSTDGSSYAVSPRLIKKLQDKAVAGSTYNDLVYELMDLGYNAEEVSAIFTQAEIYPQE